MATLNLSTGRENRISVEVDGWAEEDKERFARAAQEIEGVTAVQSAGGRTSFYIYFDPKVFDEKALIAVISNLAGTISPSGSAPSSVTVGPDVLATEDGALIVTENGAPIAIGSAPSQDAPTIASSSWTGIASVRERVAVVKEVAPIALMAVDSLIDHLEVFGSNGGPPLDDDRQDALDALRELHSALGSLLAAVERPGFEWAENEGLLASCAHYLMRAAEKLKNDPIPFAVGGLIVGLFHILGVNGVGGFLASTSLAMQKKTK